MQDLLEGCDLGSLGWSQSPVLSAVWLAEIPDVSWFRMLVGYFWDLKLHFVWQFCWINLNHINQTPWFIVLRSPSCCNPPSRLAMTSPKSANSTPQNFPHLRCQPQVWLIAVYLPATSSGYLGLVPKGARQRLGIGRAWRILDWDLGMMKTSEPQESQEKMRISRGYHWILYDIILGYGIFMEV